MHFEVLGPVSEIETIARGPGIRTLGRLRKRHGGRGWRKLKGVATVRISDSRIRRAEVHWYEAHGIGSRGWKIKRFLD